MMNTILKKLVDFGINIAKANFKAKIEEKNLQDELSAFIQIQGKYNELCMIGEEIDFQGLVDYIQSDLMDDARIRMFSHDKEKRGRARQEIIDAAISYSKAESETAKYRVSKSISICLDIIRDFYKRKIKLENFILADMCVEDIKEKIQDSADNATRDMKACITDEIGKLSTALDKKDELLSIEKGIELAKAGNINEIQDGFNSLLRHISIEHPYYPDFAYDYRGGQFISKPLTMKAKKKYPHSMKVNGTIKVGSKPFSGEFRKLLDYSYRHQTPFAIEVSDAENMLGNRHDPCQNEAEILKGNTIYAIPPEFPPAFACAIKAGETTYFEYVLLRSQEIEDDGTCIIGNREQGGNVYFELKVDSLYKRSPRFTISMKNATNKELLNYVKFMKALEKEEIHIYLLSEHKDLLYGGINDVEYKSGFLSVEEEIEFLESICCIEDYFGVRIDLPQRISKKAFMQTINLAELIRNDDVKSVWTEATFTGNMTQHFREEVLKMGDNMHVISYVGNREIDLFGEHLVFPYMKTFKCARFKDFEKLKRKIEILDDGDSINFTMETGNDNTVIETMKIPENMITENELSYSGYTQLSKE